MPNPIPALPTVQYLGTDQSGPGVTGQSNTGPGVLGQSLGLGGGGARTVNGVVVATDPEPASDGVLGNGENGVHGQSNSTTGSGVWGENTGAGVGVSGSSVSGDGIFGRGAANGVHGQSASATNSGVWGENTGAGVGISGSSVSGVGILGHGAKNGVHGQSASATDSGVWGENTGAGVGVAGTSVTGDGVLGQGAANGVHGQSASATNSGVWGENTGAGVGVAGSSVTGLAGQFTGPVSITGDLSVTGDASLTGTLTTHDVQLSDCAEDFDIAETDGAEAGAVMVLDDKGNLCPNECAYDKRVVGVISGAGLFKPAIILGRSPRRGKRMPIALFGKVYCKVDSDYAPVEVGDLLTTSPTRGHAMKALDSGRSFGSIIGKALQSLPNGQGLIPILVVLQ